MKPQIEDKNEGIDKWPCAIEQIALECLGIDRLYAQLETMPPSHRHILTTRQIVEAILQAYETGYLRGRQQQSLEQANK